MRPWTTLDRVVTPDGELELRRRGEADFLLALDGRVLMQSTARRSEEALGARTAEAVAARRAPRVLVGGLGMGITLRAALERLPPDARVGVVELHARVVAWCRGPLAALSGDALADPRVGVEVGDVADAIARTARAGGAERLDAIVLDLYEGPHARTQPERDPFYGRRALERSRAALRPGGVLAVWGEAPDRGFERRLVAAGFRVARARPGRGGRRHAVVLAFAGEPRGAPRRR